MATRIRFRFPLAGALIAVAVALIAPAANAGLISGIVSGVVGVRGCATEPASQVFAPWSDPASYELAPNGGFEAGTTGWSLTGGAQVVANNESFHISGAGSHALALPDGSSATTGPVCLGGLTRASARLFVANAGSPSSKLRVDVIYRGLTGIVGVLNGGTVSAGSSWRPTPALLALELPILGSASVQLRFTPVGAGGSWLIDDVYVDPYCAR